MSTSADRLAAARILLRIEDGAYSSRLLGGSLPAGVRTRVLGVLRWQRSLDHVLGSLTRRPLPRLDGEVRQALRVGLYEACQLGVPPPVATDAAVHLIRRLGCSSAAGMVNAVMRRSVPAWHKTIPDAPADLRLSHPAWLYRRWAERFGATAAEQMMAVAQTPAALWVWFRRQEERHDLETAGIALQPHPWCPDAWSAPGHNRELIAAVQRGGAYAQDPASQLVAHLAHRLSPDEGSFIDLCAAPGGKAARLLALGRRHPGVAVDRSLQRCRLVSSLLGGPGQRCLVVTADATQPPLRSDAWDLVLLDAPCSGTGTLRRHPELRWRLRPESAHELAVLQRRLLAGALPLVKPGGMLLYATCSIELEENEELLGEDLPGGFERPRLDAVLPEGTPWQETAAGGARLLPGPDNDGFTVHALHRR